MGTARAPLVVGVGAGAILAAATTARLWALDRPALLVFDETYYVKDAFSLLQFGYEGVWAADANDSWAAGHPTGLSTDPAFVAHPPLGKWVIALGMALFGAESPWGWRIGIALAGILLVALTMLVAQLLFARPALSLIAGGLMAVDGVAIVLSRVSLLDTALALFALLGFAGILLDRRWVRKRIDAWVEKAPPDPGEWGPLLGLRPWLIATGAALGLASGVKWSALYLLAALGIVTVLLDVIALRRAGVHWTASSLRQVPLDFLRLIPVAAATHLVTWSGWFATSGGYHRNWVTEGGQAWEGMLAWVPEPLQNWWHYQSTVYAFHTGLSSTHGYQAHPAGWPLLLRPTSMWYEDFGDSTAAEIVSLGNPLIWWAGTAALIALLLRVVAGLVARRAVAAEALVLVGMAAGWLPWLLYPDRPVFQFYSIVFLPYLAIALAFWMELLLGRPDDPVPVRRVGAVAVGLFGLAVVALSVYFWPLWSGMELPAEALRHRWWFPGWI